MVVTLLACIVGVGCMERVSSALGSKEPVCTLKGVVPLPADQLNGALLIGKRFELTVMKGEPFILTHEAPLPFLQFAEGLQFNGRACNLFFGGARLEEGQLFSEHVAMTQMLCVDAPLNQLDQAIGEAFQQGMTIGLQDSQLVVYNEAHGLLFEHRN